MDTVLARLRREDFIRRFLARDASLWKSGESHARVIGSRMGWLDAAAWTRQRAGELRRFAGEAREAGLRHAVLLGMGGSSLCPDVLRRTFRRRPGHPELHVLDTTDPEAIASVGKVIDPEHTLFIVASKSGTTLESSALARHFFQMAPGSHFAAITDPGTPLEKEARERGYRAVFLNPPDIGGRYSALSLFGMVPAALLGLDVDTLLARGQAAVDRLRPGADPAEVEAVALGAALGALGAARLDKITFVLSPAIASFGYWLEQLVAESTGKEGKGLVPVEGEELGPPSRYGSDRVFVRLALKGGAEPGIDRRLAALRRAGHPVITLLLRDRLDLGAEFNRWEIATAVAGAVLGINPFDEPNVQESKDNTRRMLEQVEASGSLPQDPPDLEEAGVRAWAGPPAWKRASARGLGPLLSAIISSARPRDYVALMAYVADTRPVRERLQAIRMALRDRCRAAATLGFGPRFLHSTGQLHKGGPPRGLFVQITSDKTADLRVPGESWSFGTLQAAQAAGDFQALRRHGLRAVRLHIEGDKARGLDALLSRI